MSWMCRLGAGNHVVRMEYYEDTGTAFAYLNYQNVSSGCRLNRL